MNAFALAARMAVVSCVAVASAQTAANLSSVTTVPTGLFGSNALVAADFNGDQFDDLLVAHNVAPRDLVLLAGDGQGGFTASDVGLAGVVAQVVTGRFDADSELDIAWITASALNVRLGAGGGTFGATITITLSSALSSLAAAELTGDGKVDLAVTDSQAGTLTILTGDGLGGFAASATFACGSNPSYVNAGNLNGDAWRDLAVANLGSAQLTLVFNSASGFGAPMSIALASPVKALDVADLDADLDLDLVASTNLGVVVLRGLGGGAFPTQETYAAGPTAERVLVVDASGDGLLDIVAVGASDPHLTVLANLGTQGFAAQRGVPIAGGTEDLAAGDFDADGFVDLATVNASSAGRVWLARGPAQPIYDVTNISKPNYYPRELHAVDLDFDGDVDLAGTAVNLGFMVYRNNGVSLDAPVAFSTGEITDTLAVGDLNNDGRLDVLTAGYNGFGVVMLRQPNGTYAKANEQRIGRGPTRIVLADFNNDGNLDDAATNENHDNVSVRLGDGSGAFSPMVEYATGLSPLDLVAARIDGDSVLDLAVATYGSQSPGVVWLRGNGAGGFINMGVLASNISHDVDAADLDGDGDTDLVVCGILPEIFVLLNSGAGVFTSFNVKSGGAYPRATEIADLDGDGDLDIAVSNSLSHTTGLVAQAAPGQFEYAGEVPVGNTPYDIVSGDFDGDGSLDLAVSNFYSYSLSLLTGAQLAYPDFAIYCTAKVNSLGCSPAVAVSGLPSVSSPQPCSIRAENELSQAPGTAFYGFTPAAQPLSGGYLCVSGALRRTPLQSAGGSATADCTGIYDFDLNAWIRTGNDPALVAGRQLFLQFWSRDGASAIPVNLTNALRLVIAP